MLLNIFLTWLFGYPVHNVIEERLAGAVHTTEFVVIASLNRLKTPEQELLLYWVLLYSLLVCWLLLCLVLVC